MHRFGPKQVEDSGTQALRMKQAVSRLSASITFRRAFEPKKVLGGIYDGRKGYTIGCSDAGDSRGQRPGPNEVLSRAFDGGYRDLILSRKSSFYTSRDIPEAGQALAHGLEQSGAFGYPIT